MRCACLVALLFSIPYAAIAADYHYEDVTTQAGLTHIQQPNRDWDEQWKNSSYHPSVDLQTGGVAVADFFGNGFQDVYFTRDGEADILYQNMGDGTFVDRTADVFIDGMPKLRTNGAVFADLDNDGHVDLFVTTAHGPRHYLYMNDGKGHLIEQAQERGAAVVKSTLEEYHNGSSVTVGDYDGDHYLDVYISSWHLREEGQPAYNRLLRNLGKDKPGYFEDVTVAAGLDTPSNQYGYSGRFADMDKDGDMDLLVTNDHRNSQYYQNNGDGTFSEVSVKMGTGTGLFEMGSTVADYNNDGWLDWFVTSIHDELGNRLYRNEMGRNIEDVYFTEQSSAGVNQGYWGWGTSFIDWNNDGYRDLVMVNGFWFPRYQDTPMKFWRNEGKAGKYRFADIGESIGLTDNGQGRGLSVADFDNDGQLDILIVNWVDTPRLYRNTGGENSWLRIEVIGEKSNRMGVGAFITVIPDIEQPDVIMVHDVNLGSNFLSHNEIIAHFGLGARRDTIDVVRIDWPSGVHQEFKDIKVNQKLSIHETHGIMQ